MLIHVSEGVFTCIFKCSVEYACISAWCAYMQVLYPISLYALIIEIIIIKYSVAGVVRPHTTRVCFIVNDNFRDCLKFLIIFKLNYNYV